MPAFEALKPFGPTSMAVGVALKCFEWGDYTHVSHAELVGMISTFFVLDLELTINFNLASVQACTSTSSSSLPPFCILVIELCLLSEFYVLYLIRMNF